MLTPRFELSQTNNDITVTIYAPYANIAETEIFVADEHFRFFSSPYYLRLHLPGCVEETDVSTAHYEAESGKFVISVAKVTKGEHFKDLDLLTTLLAPRKAKNCGKAAIEVLDTSEIKSTETEDSDDDSEWFIEQTLEESQATLASAAIAYGFASQCSGVFSNFKHEFREIVELVDPDSTSVKDRQHLQTVAETTDFCESHYLADLMEDEIVQQLLQFHPVFEDVQSPVELTSEELDMMKELPNREYLLSKSERLAVYHSLVDLLFGFCYNHRTNEADNNSESAWTINKLSATLSWLQSFESLQDAVKSSVRRSLVYPLHRNHQLALKVVADVQCILRAGKKRVLKCLLEIYSLFNASEPRYLLNRLYIQDYCVWIQQSSANRLNSLADAISQVLPSKSDLDLDLVELETAASVVQEEESLTAVENQLSQLHLDTAQNAEQASSSSESDSESDSSDSESELNSDDISDKE